MDWGRGGKGARWVSCVYLLASLLAPAVTGAQSDAPTLSGEALWGDRVRCHRIAQGTLPVGATLTFEAPRSAPLQAIWVRLGTRGLSSAYAETYRVALHAAATDAVLAESMLTLTAGGEPWREIEAPGVVLAEGASYEIRIMPTTEGPFGRARICGIVDLSGEGAGMQPWSLRWQSSSNDGLERPVDLRTQPIFALRFADGVLWGQPYSALQRHHLSESSPLDTPFVPSATTAVESMTVRLLALGEPGAATYQIRDENEQVLVAGTLTGNASGNARWQWLGAAFPAPVLLERDRAYWLHVALDPGSDSFVHHLLVSDFPMPSAQPLSTLPLARAATTSSASTTTPMVAFSAISPVFASLAPNPSFESAPFEHYFTHATVPQGVSFDHVLDSSWSGSKSIRISAPTGAGLSRWLSHNDRIPARAGALYEASVRLRTKNVPGYAALALSFFDGSVWQHLSTTESVQRARGTSPWTEIQLSATAPPGAAYLRADLRLQGPGTLWADHLKITGPGIQPAPTPLPTPTPTPRPTPSPTPTPRSTPTSTPTPRPTPTPLPTPRPTPTVPSAFGGGAPVFASLAPNPSFEQDPLAHYFNHATVAQGVVFEHAADAAWSGLRAVRITAPASAGLSRWLSQNHLVPARPGAIYEYSARLRTSDVTGSAAIALSFFDGTVWQHLATTESIQHLTGTQPWTEVRVVATAPAATAYVRVDVRLWGGGVVWGDHVALSVAGSTPVPTPSPAPSPAASPTPQPTPTVIGTPTPSGGTGAALTRLPIYCRLHSFPATDKAAAYKRCNFMDEMIENTCTARAGANAAGNTSAQIGYYNSFAASDSTCCGRETAMFDQASSGHRDWWVRTRADGQCQASYPSSDAARADGCASYANYPFFFPLYDFGNTAYVDEWARNALNFTNASCVSYIFADNSGSAGALGASTVYTPRIDGGRTPYSSRQQSLDLAVAAARTTENLSRQGKSWYANYTDNPKIYDGSTAPVVNQEVRQAYLAMPGLMVEFFMVDSCLPPQQGCLGRLPDSGDWSALKGFDISWDMEKHGRAVIYGCNGKSARDHEYKIAAGLQVIENRTGRSTFGGCIDSAREIFPWYDTNLGAPLGDYSCRHTAIRPAPPADVTGPLGNIHCGAGAAAGGGLYQRTFEHGLVVVNLSGGPEGAGGTSYTIDLPRPMKDVVRGTIATSFTVPPKEGRILLHP